MAAGDEHSVAIAGDGRVFTWGKSTGATGSASTGANRADLATTKLPLEGSGGPGAGSYTLTVTAGKQQTLATTAKGEVWVWGDNADGQLGTGCASLGQVLTPTLAEGVPAASISSWRLVPLSKPASLQTLSLVGQPYAGILGTVIDAQDPSLVPVAGGAAACRTACETHSTNLGGAAGSCVAFTFNRTSTDTSIQPGPLSCVFYQSAGIERTLRSNLGRAQRPPHPRGPGARWCRRGGFRLLTLGGRGRFDSDRAVPRQRRGRAAVRRELARNMCAWHVRVRAWMERRWVHETSLRTRLPSRPWPVRLVGEWGNVLSVPLGLGRSGLHRVELPDLRRGVMRFARDVRDQPGGWQPCLPMRARVGR